MKTAKINTNNNVMINVVYLFFGNVVTKFIGAIATILYAQFTSVNEYGILSIALSFSIILSFLTDAGIGHTALREATKKEAQVGQIMYSYIRVRCILLIVVALFSTILIHLIYPNDIQIQQAILILVLPALIGSLLQGIGNTYFQIIEEMKYTSYTNILLSIGNSLALIGGVVFKWPFIVICLVYGISSIVAGIYATVMAFKRIKLEKVFEPAILQQLISFTANTFIFILTPQLGPIILERVLSVVEVGYFSAAFKIPAMLYQFPSIIATAFYPKLFTLANRKEIKLHRKTSSLELQLMTILGVILTLPFALNPKYWITLLLGTKYLPAVSVLCVLSLLILTQAIKYPLADYLTTSGRQWSRTLVMLAGLLLSILGYIVLGNRYGVLGGAIAPLLADLIVILGCTIFIPKGFSFLANSILVILGNTLLVVLLYNFFLQQLPFLLSIVLLEVVFCGLTILTNQEVKKIIHSSWANIKARLHPPTKN